MSIFSSIRKSRQQAKEHNSKLADQKKKEEEKVPYRHVPTHAASDAFASAPPSWREAADRPRIIEENRRRSAMAASGHHMNMPSVPSVPSVPRIGSSLSYVSYPGGASQPFFLPSSASSVAGGGGGGGGPRMRVPRTYSTGGVSHYSGGGRDMIYSIPDVSHSDPASLKEYSLSQDGSSSSQDDLEMPRVSRPPVVIGKGRPAVKAHRLHPSNRSRRTSDASIDRAAPAVPIVAATATPFPPSSPSSASAPRQDSWLPLHNPRTSSLSYGASRHIGIAAQPLNANAIAPESPTRASAHEESLRALESRQSPPPNRAEPSRAAQGVVSPPVT